MIDEELKRIADDLARVPIGKLKNITQILFDDHGVGKPPVVATEKTLTLTGNTGSNVPLTKAVRVVITELEIEGYGLKMAVNLVKNVPSVIHTSKDEALLLSIKADLEAVGGVLTLE